MEHSHGPFWLRGPGTQNSDKQSIGGPSTASYIGQLVDICPLCCRPLDEREDACTGIDRPAEIPEPQASNIPPRKPPLESQEEESERPSDSKKKGLKSVRFNVIQQYSGPPSERIDQSATNLESTKSDHRGIQRTTNTMMLNHIADHLQFLAVLTPRLSTEKLAVGDVEAFSSSRTSNDYAFGKRSTLSDEFELSEANEVKEIEEPVTLQESLQPEARSTPSFGEPIDWSTYSIPRLSYLPIIQG